MSSPGLRASPAAYPDATYAALREALAAYTGFPPEQIIPTAGCDEALLVCGLLTLGPGRRAYARSPYYGYYSIVTRLTGAELVDDPGAAVDLTWVCAPHNPTGADAVPEDVAERDGLVVIDQAYVEFGGSDLSGLVRERQNTVVLRTFSKAFALAGVRVGYILAPPELAPRLDAVRPPASIGVHAAALAEIALDHVDDMRSHARTLCAERARIAEGLERAGLAVSPSCTNFVLVDLGRPAEPVARRAARARGWSCAPSRIRCSRRRSASARRRPPRATACSRPWARRCPPGRRPRRRSAPARPTGARARPTSPAGSSSTAPAARRWRPASACSTTC